MRYYYFLDDENFIRIKANRKPSEKTIPSRGTWVLSEFIPPKGFKLPCFGEITLGRIKKMRFIGSEKVI